MNDTDYGALFDVEVESLSEPGIESGMPLQSENGAHATDKPQWAQPSQNPTGGTPESENTREDAEPAGTDGNDAADDSGRASDGKPEVSDTKPEASEKKKQDSAENARYAAARRKAEAERDAAILSERQRAKAELDQAIRSLGIIDPFTGQLVSDKEQYDRYRSRETDATKDRIIKRSGMTEAQFEEFVGNLPEVKRAKRAEEEAEAVRKEAEEARAKAKVDEQIRQIRLLDSSIKELSDLTALENYDEFYELVKKGNTLLDAYKIATYDTRMKRVEASAKQATLNAIGSKEHLSKTETRGAGAITVPTDVKEQYLLFNPNATDAEIEAHYNRYHKL